MITSFNSLGCLLKAAPGVNDVTSYTNRDPCYLVQKMDAKSLAMMGRDSVLFRVLGMNKELVLNSIALRAYFR